MKAADPPLRLSPAEFAGSAELTRLMSCPGPEEDRNERAPKRLEGCVRPLEILLVEEGGEGNDSLSLRLEQAGYRVTSALNGNSALHEYARRGPDLVLLDLSLPQRNGLELLREFHRQPGHETIPVVVITASDDPVLEVEAWLWGARDVVRKPVSEGRLLRAVQAFAEEGSGNGLTD